MLTRRQWMKGAATSALLAFEGPRALAQAEPDLDWPVFRGNAAMNGLSGATLPSTPRLAWTFEAGEVPTAPVVSGGRVFVADSTGRVAALDLSTGRPIWTKTIAAGFEGAPTAAGDRVLLADLEGVVRAFDAGSGEVLWSATAEGAPEIKASVVIALPGGAASNGVAVVGSYDGTLHAFDLKTGARKWSHETEAQIHATCAVQGSLVFAAGCDGRFRGLEAATGEVKVDVRFGGYTAATPAIDAGRAIFGTFSNDVVAIDLAKRTVAWRYAPTKPFPFFASAALARGLAFLGSRDKSLHVLDAATGERRWEVATAGKVDSSPLVAGSRVFFGSHDGKLRGVEIASRQTVFSYDAGVPIGTAPAAASGRLLCAVEDGRILCFS